MPVDRQVPHPEETAAALHHAATFTHAAQSAEDSNSHDGCVGC